MGVFISSQCGFSKVANLASVLTLRSLVYMSDIVGGAAWRRQHRRFPTESFLLPETAAVSPVHLPLIGAGRGCRGHRGAPTLTLPMGGKHPHRGHVRSEHTLSQTQLP